ncbi:unnamed protein product [Rotaria sp. Silwood1]|nr:unnamed protein product [Rotaria sp. Silwood1]
MLITTTTGYILAAYGPYLSDNSNNDASIQKDMLVNNKDGILNWFDEHDIAVVDRGFRDSTGMMRALELDVCMPDFLNGRRRFDALEANRSRFTSKIRWVVESANGRVKHFKWFNQTIQNSTIPQVRDYLQIACALINAYRAAAISSFSNDDRIAAKMLACFHEPNLLRIRLNNETLRWINNDASNIVNFPILTIDQIRLITVEQVTNSCCDCPGGDREVGVCSYRAAAIWFLGYQRHSHESSTHQPSGTYLKHIDDSDLVDDFVDSSDEDDDFLYSLP